MEDIMKITKEHVNEGLKSAKEFLKLIDKKYDFKPGYGTDLNDAAEVLSEHIGKKIEILEDDLTFLSKKSGINDEISGLTFFSEKENKFYIVIEKKDLPFRKRFTIAHELGHIYMNDIKDGKSILFRSTCENDGQFSPNFLNEQKANAFASEILMPTNELSLLLKLDLTLEEIADLFGVSYKALRNKISKI